MTVAILGKIRCEWGSGDVIVIQVDDLYFAQPFEREDEIEADEIGPELAVDLLTRHHVKLTNAGRAWMREQRELWTKFQLAERRASPRFY